MFITKGVITTQIVIAIIGSGALSALISGIFNIISQKKKKQNGILDAVRQILYNYIKKECKNHISNGYISPEDLEDLITTHKIYHDSCNGNGFLDEYMNAVKKLQVK